MYFNIFYQTKNKRGQWVNARQTETTFMKALERLNQYNCLAETRPDMYRNVKPDFDAALD